MSKAEPENRADLYRMLKTSNGWFDGQIEYEQVRDPYADYISGEVDSETVHVSASPYIGCDVQVYKNRHVVKDVRGPRSCSLDVLRVWTRNMTFDEFRASEWWKPTIEKFAGGSCDASEIFVRCDETDEGNGTGPDAYVHISAQCEKHYRDFLNNDRVAKGHDDVSLWLQGNGDMGLTLNGKTYELDVNDLAEFIEQARSFRESGVELDDGKLVVKLGSDES